MNLLFDYGGVLVDLDKQRCIRAFEALGFDIRPLSRHLCPGRFLLGTERGAISVEGFCDKIREAAGNESLSDTDICNAWKDYLTGVPAERLEMLLKIARHYPVYLLSNTNTIHWKMAEEDYFNFQGTPLTTSSARSFFPLKSGRRNPRRKSIRPLLTASAATLHPSSSTIPTSTAMPHARWGCRPAWRLPTVRGSRSSPPTANIFLKRSDAWERHIS